MKTTAFVILSYFVSLIAALSLTWTPEGDGPALIIQSFGAALAPFGVAMLTFWIARRRQSDQPFISASVVLFAMIGLTVMGALSH